MTSKRSAQKFRFADAVRRVVLRPLSPIPYPLSVFVAALALVTVPASAADFPHLHPGLWEMQRTSDRPGEQPNRATMCLDDSVQKEMFDMGAGAMQGMCSKHEFHFSGNRATGDFICSMGGSTMHSKSTMVLTGDTAYRTEIDTTYEPPMMGHARTKTVITAKHLGACKPGQRAGDLVLPNGQTMNVHDVITGARNAQRAAPPDTQPGARRPAPPKPN
jgi:hypothetical protein